MFDVLRDARTVCSACSSGANALLLGVSRLLSGRASCVLAGGADGLCRLTYVGFSALGALSPKACRPFSAHRDGLTLGEGAAFLVLETASHARARGVEALAEFRGWAVGSEAHHITHPQASGETAARVMAEALACAGLAPEQVAYLNAHGTATSLNDAMEVAGVKRCFAGAAERLMVSSSKAQIGHTLAAAGAVEAAISVMAIAEGRVPPTAGLEDIDEACAGVDHVRRGREVAIDAAMSTSFGFGGSDTALVFSRVGAFDAKPPSAPRRVFVTAAATLGADGLCGAEDAAQHVDTKPAQPPPERIDFQGADFLDLSRARRLDRPARMVTVIVEHGLATAKSPVVLGRDAGAIMATAYGSVDACARYVKRFTDRGARFASPAVFPNLLPSSPVAHTSVYTGLGGPVFASADIGATAESSMVAAVELLEAGQGKLIVAGGVEEASDIIDRVLGPLCTGQQKRGPRSEGAAALVFESDDGEGEVAGRAIAEVTWCGAWRDDPNSRGHANWCDVPPPAERCGVFVASDIDAVTPVLRGSGWEQVTRYAASERIGHHECAGGFAAAAAVALLKARRLDAALILGLAPTRTRALVLRATPDGAVA
jgi:3-oxoacyl-[acyl-carrier-protein] synthase II